MSVQYGMVVDTTRCMGCQTCVISCKISNEIPSDIYWGRVVNPNDEGDSPYRPKGTYPNVTLTFRPELCNHCSAPACVEVCPTGAMSKREEDGVVFVDQETCIGCGSCTKACPYEIPVLDEEASVSSKCDLCYQRLGADKLPWCVQSCPAEARIVGDINDGSSEVAQYLKDRNAQPLHEDFGTSPSVYYV